MISNINLKNLTYFVIIFSGLIRVLGINYGYPFALVSDEESMIGGALRMLEYKTLIPASEPEAFKILNYPPLIPYLYLLLITPFALSMYVLSGFPPMSEFSVQVFNNIGVIWILSRSVSVLCSIATVIVVYKIAKNIFKSPFAVLMTTILLGFEFFNVFLSHFARHWSVTVFFVWSGCLFAQYIYINRNLRNYVLTGLFSGLGFASSYIGSFGIAAGVVAHILLGKKRQNHKHCIYMLAVFSITVIIFSFLYPGAIQRLLFSGILPVHEVKNTYGYLESLKFYLTVMYQSNPALLFFTIFGLTLMLFNRKLIWFIWSVALIFGYILFIYLMMPLEDRYILIVTPVFAIIGGMSIELIMNSKSMSVSGIRKALVSISFLIIIYPICVTAHTSYLLTKKDTRIIAKEWIESNVKENSKIIVDLGHVKLESTKNALIEQKALSNGYLNAKERVFLNAYNDGINDYIKKPKYHAINIDVNFTPNEFVIVKDDGSIKLIEYIKDNNYEYIVISYRSKEYLYDWHKAIKNIASEPIITIKPSASGALPPYLHSTVIVDKPVYNLFKIDRFGPIVEVYKMFN